MCKMSRERVSGVGGEKLRWYGIWRYICYCAFCGIYLKKKYMTAEKIKGADLAYRGTALRRSFFT